MELLTEYGYFSLFLLSFLAATFLPVASEWFLAVLVLKGLNPYYLLAYATLGNYLGSCTTYLIGVYGSDFTIRKIFRIDDKKRGQAQRVYERYGVFSLLLSWIPVLGDALCFIAGVMKISFIKYSLLVFTGKLFRYALAIYLITVGESLISG